MGKRHDEALFAFLESFDMTLEVLDTRLAAALGRSVVDPMPLDERIAQARKMGIWSEDDTLRWHGLLSLRCAVLLKESRASRRKLRKGREWLDAFNLRIGSVSQ